MKIQFHPRIIGFLVLITSTAFLSGCALNALTYGQKIAGIPGLGKAVTGWVTTEDGEIVAYCCNTSCAEAESVKEFKEEFLTALEKKVSDEKERARVMSQVEFIEKPPVECQAEQSIVFSVDYKVGGITRTKSTTIKLTDLGSNGDTDARKDLQSTLEKFEDEFKNGAKLKIELTVCNGSEAAAAQTDADAIYTCDENSSVSTQDAFIFEEPGRTGQQLEGFSSDYNETGASSGNELKACLDCQPQAPEEVEFKFDWAGIL